MKPSNRFTRNVSRNATASGDPTRGRSWSISWGAATCTTVLPAFAATPAAPKGLLLSLVKNESSVRVVDRNERWSSGNGFAVMCSGPFRTGISSSRFPKSSALLSSLFFAHENHKLYRELGNHPQDTGTLRPVSACLAEAVGSSARRQGWPTPGRSPEPIRLPGLQALPEDSCQDSYSQLPAREEEDYSQAPPAHSACWACQTDTMCLSFWRTRLFGFPKIDKRSWSSPA